MNLTIKVSREDRKTCSFCRNAFFPSPNVSCPKTCGRPECVRTYRRSFRTRHPAILPLSDYHRMLDGLWKKGLIREWTLVHVLAETGMTVKDLVDLKVGDLFFDGPVKLVAIRSLGKNGPRVLHPVSGRTAGVIERWSAEHESHGRIFPFTRKTLHKAVKRAFKVSSLEGYDTRSLRHMYGAVVAMATDSEKTVAGYLRVKDLSSARFYVRYARKLFGKGA